MKREFDFKIVSDPRIFQENSLQSHSDHEFYSSEEAARTGERSDFKILLNGLWKFAYAKNPSLAIPKFYSLKVDCHEWDEIRVPAHIQMEGYDKPQYANSQYPWDGYQDVKPGQIPEEFNPTAMYVKYFTLPQELKGRPVYISFQGVESGMALWLNGQYVGYREDTFTPSEFDLTPYLQEGENKLAAEVFKWTAGSWCEDQDFFRFSGIFREVYLYTVPKVHVRDLRIVAEPDDTMTRGQMHIKAFIGAMRPFRPFTKGEISGEPEKDADAKIAGRDAAADADSESADGAGADGEGADNEGTENQTLGTYKAQLLDDEGRVAAEKTGTLTKENDILAEIPDVKLWSAEDPYLYTLMLTVFEPDGTVSEVVREAVGFRRFEIKQAQMLLNGKRIVFHGTDRHEFGSTAGRVLSQEEIRQDIINLKRHNINAIRTSHYPNQTILYRLCDEYGIYLINEANIETHGTWTAEYASKEEREREVVPGDRPEFLELILDRGRNMVERDKNHPSVLIWSLGNEAFGGWDFAVMSKDVHFWDKTRVIHYEGVMRDLRYPYTTDIWSNMYAPAEKVRAFVAEHKDKPYISCEYSHAMGNSCGGIRKYVELMWDEPLYQGGFIWDYIDQSLDMRDRFGKEYQGYGGDHGEHPTDYNFSGNGIAYAKDRQPSPKMQEVRAVYQYFRIRVKRDSFTLENGNLFTPSSAYECVVSLLANGKTICERTVETAVQPFEKKSYPLPFTVPGHTASDTAAPGSAKAGAGESVEYLVNVSLRLKEDTKWARRGYEVAWGQGVFGQMPLDASEKNALPERNTIEPYGNVYAQEPRLVVTKGDFNIGVKGDHFSILFSQLNGGLVSYNFGGKEMLTPDIPRPNFWRPLTDNDMGSTLGIRAGQWQAASNYPTIKVNHGYGSTKYEYEIREDLVRVSFTLHLATRPALDAVLSYTVHPDGQLDVKLSLPKSDMVGELPELSVLLSMDAQYDQLQWYGRGPEETYADRKSAKIGIYRNKVADNFAKYMVPQESGWKEDVRIAEVTNKLGRGLRFACRGLGFSALPYSPMQIDAAAHANELPPVLKTYIRVGTQMGVGGDDSWGAMTHDEFKLDNSKPLSIEFTMKGI